MANVLNLALKKNIFDELTNFRINEIPIKKNDWWKKRLMDLDTGVFKKFDVACVSCGSSDKFNFEIDHIEESQDIRALKILILNLMTIQKIGQMMNTLKQSKSILKLLNLLQSILLL